VTYKWNGLWGRPDNDRDVVGVIGQELESIAPYLVMRTLDRLYKDGMVTEVVEIDTTAIIMVLVNTFMDLRARLRKLEEEDRRIS
jgi:hypothetical protein